MSSSQYSAGSEEGEIRPKKKMRRTVDPNMPTAIRTGTSGTHARDTRAPRNFDRRTSPDIMRPPPPPPPPATPRAVATNGSERTLFQELQEVASRSRPTSVTESRPTHTSVPPFPGYVNRGSSSNNPIDRHETVSQPWRPGSTVAGPPPSANMVTASQEQRGITHGTQPTDFDEVTVAMPQRKSEAVINSQQLATATTPADTVSKDPYQAQVEVIEQHQDLADSSYEPSHSQDTPPPFIGTVDTQEAIDLANADMNMCQSLQSDTATSTDFDQPASARRFNECEECGTSLDDEPYTWKCTRCEHSGLCATCYTDPHIVDRNGHHNHKFVSVRARAQQSAAGPSTSSSTTPREQVIERQRRKMLKSKYGVRHMPYSSLKQESAKHDRDRAIRQIKQNWPGAEFWPRALAPRSNGILLQPRDVSTSLLSVLVELSDLTKRDSQTGHDAMSTAVAERRAAQNVPADHIKLLPDDVKVAIELCSDDVDAAGDEDNLTMDQPHIDSETESESLDIVSSEDIAVHPRPRPLSHDTTNDTFDTSVTFQQSPTTYSHPADDEMEVVSEDGGHVHRTVPSSVVDEEVARPTSVSTAGEDRRNTTPARQQESVPTAVTPAGPAAQWREKLRATPSNRTFQIPYSDKWTDHVAEFQELFEWMSAKADVQEKKGLKITFQIDEE